MFLQGTIMPVHRGGNRSAVFVFYSIFYADGNVWVQKIYGHEYMVPK